MQSLACGLAYFVLGFTGPPSEAEEIKEQLRTCLRAELKLELSQAKTLITHARSGAARLLGYEITVRQANRKRTKNRASGTKRRSINGHIGLRVPRAVLVDKGHRYRKHNKVMPRTELLNESDDTIISTYQLEFQGIAHYYQLAYNLHTLHSRRWVMDQSLTKTLARKHHTSVQHIVDKSKADLLVDGVIYQGLRVVAPREGKKPLVATWGGIPLQWDIQATLEDQPELRWNRQSEVEKRLLAQVCEQCGATLLTDLIEGHHI